MKYLRTHMRWIMGFIVVAFLLSTFMMYDSGSSRRGRNSDGTVRDYPVAEVNGKRLMLSDLNLRVQQYLADFSNRDLTSLDLAYLYQRAFDQYVMEDQMAKEVRESNISVSDADIDQAVKDYADQAFPTREAFYQDLERTGRKLSDYKKDVAQQMATQMWVQRSLPPVVLSDDEIVQFYDEAKEFFFKQPSGYKINLANFFSQAPAEKLREELLAGKSWAEATSADALVSTDVRGISTEMFVPESTFDGRLSSMKDLEIGSVSTVFEMSSDDFAVGVKEEKIEEKIFSFEEVSQDIRMLLQQQRESAALNQFSENLYNRAKINILDESIFPSQKTEALPLSTPNLPAESEDK